MPSTSLYARTGGRTRDRVRRRLRMGINEVTKFLETTAASSGSNDCSNTSSRNDGGGGGSGGSGGSGGGEAIVIISGDVRPTRLVEHLHALVALTGEVKNNIRLFAPGTV